MSEPLGGGGEDNATTVKFVLFVGIVALVVAGSVVGGLVFSDPGATRSVADGPNPDQPPAEFSPDNVNPDRLTAGGQAGVAEPLMVGNGIDEPRKIVIARASRAEQEQIRPLVLALVEAGHQVTFANDDELETALADADAYVRIDPGNELSEEQVEEVRELTDQGGRVLMMAEPNRKSISASLLTVSIVTTRTEMTNLGREYGVVFGNRYLYDTSGASDGNYRHIIARPTAAGPSGTDTIAMYTAAAVQYRQGTPVLRTPETTRRSDDNVARSWSVAVRTGGGNVLAVGDKTFLESGRHNVAGNERFVSYLAEFLISGETGGGTDTTDNGTGATDNGTASSLAGP
jgi:hypothetical protein